MLYWDMVIKDLDKEFIDTLANDFDIDYYECNIDTLPPIEDSTTNQLIKYIYEKAIDKIVDNIPEEIIDNIYKEIIWTLWKTLEEYSSEIKDDLKETLKDNIYLNYLDSSIDIWTEKLANEYSKELADYILDSWLINY